MNDRKTLEAPMITNPEAWGLVPDMLSPYSNMPLWEQIHVGYGHGGGWMDFNGFTVNVMDRPKAQDGKVYSLSYPGDPDLRAMGRITMNGETLVIFPASFVLWVSEDGNETKVARID